MKYCLSLILLMLAVGCGKPTLQIDGFESYIDQFEKDALARGRNIKVEDLVISFMVRPIPGSNAKCVKNPTQTPTILIDKNWWENHDELDHISLIYHELGHCILNRSHDNELVENNRPKSLMFYGGVEGFYLRDNQREYLNELFN